LNEKVLRSVCQGAENGDLIGKIIYKSDTMEGMAEIVKMNETVSVIFDKNKYYTVVLDMEMSSDRYINKKRARELLLERWKENSYDMPDDIADYLKEKGVEPIHMEIKDLVEAIHNCGYNVHENIDLRTVTLVPDEVHHGISHFGGRGLAERIEMEIATKNVDQLIDAPANYTPAFAQ